MLRIAVICMALVLIACGDESTGPEQPPLTPSEVSLEFTGDSSTVDGDGHCQITVSWTECTESSFESYTLYRSLEQGISGGTATELCTVTDPEVLEYIDDDVQWATVYHYALLTSGVDVDSVWSNEDSLETPGTSPTPSILSWSSSLTTIDLTWTECPDDDFLEYSLYRSEYPGIQDDTTAAQRLQTFSSPSDTLFEDSGLEEGVLYYYAIRTKNVLGISSWSNEAAAQLSSGGLPVVMDLALDSGSGGRTVVLAWSPVQVEITGYHVYFRETEEDDWMLIGDAVTNGFVHDATCAGSYSVKAYTGELESEDYAEPVSTLPAIIDVTYTIYDNFAPADRHTGFIFGPEFGQTGLASSTTFIQDIYLYDDSKGDIDASLYSGNIGPFGNGNQSYFQEPAPGVYGNCDPEGMWYDISYALYSSDSVVFIELPYATGSSAYVKMYGLTLEADPDTADGTSLTFRYEYQSNQWGFTLFTTSSQR